MWKPTICLLYLLVIQDATAQLYQIPNCVAVSPPQPVADSPVSASDIANWISKAVTKNTVIVGGGVSGLYALDLLLKAGYSNSVLLEARDKLGGRIRTIRQGNVILEDGAQWINGNNASGNILYKMAASINAIGINKFDKEPQEELRVMRADSTVGSSEDWLISNDVDVLVNNGMKETGLSQYFGKGYGYFYEDLFQRDIASKYYGPTVDAWHHFMRQYIAGYEGSDALENISAVDADNFRYEPGAYSWKDGFETIVKYLQAKVPATSYTLNSPVKKIIWELSDRQGALVVTDDGNSYLADRVVVTLPLGYLQKYYKSLFTPPLPQPKEKAITGMILGHADKIFIGWSSYWWGNNNMGTRVLWTKFDLPQDKEWLYGIVDIFTADYGNPILVTFITGCSAEKMERLPDETVKADFMFLMRKIFPGKTVPEPTVFWRSKWINEPWTYGSYTSYITLNGEKAGLKTRDPISNPLVNKWGDPTVYWAGEHTDFRRFGTVDGALYTSERVVADIKSGQTGRR